MRLVLQLPNSTVYDEIETSYVSNSPVYIRYNDTTKLLTVVTDDSDIIEKLLKLATTEFNGINLEKIGN
ncbi:MAG: hypothetical protein HC907_22095 [Richelia sp. SM1_7_0]|nr:hypothetical protein [Richelia sp. SM1_7_0]